MIKTVIFDIDNTLYNYTKANEYAFAELSDFVGCKLGIKEEEFKDLHDFVMADVTKTTGPVAACHNRLIRYQNILEMKNLPLHYALTMYDIYWGGIVKNSTPSKGAVEIMKYLNENKFRIGIGTDMTAWIQHIKLREFGLLDYINFIVSSEEASCEKPEKKFFELCIRKSKCDASEILFVGDNIIRDVYGAKAMNINALWYVDEIQNDKSDVAQITDLIDIKKYL